MTRYKPRNKQRNWSPLGPEGDNIEELVLLAVL